MGMKNAGHPSTPLPRQLGQELNGILKQGPRLLNSQSALTPGFGDIALGADQQYLMGDANHPGVLSLYANSVLPQMTAAANAANTSARTAAANDLTNLGPQFSQGIRNTSPESTALYDKLAQQAGEGLDAGSLMTPAQFAQLNNSIRSAQGARGMSYGPAASYQEVLANSDFGQNLLQERQKFAGDISRMGYDQYTAPVLQSMGGIRGDTGGAGNFIDRAGSFSGGAMGYGDIFGRLGNYASDLYNTNYNAQAAADIAAFNGRVANTGATMSAMSQMGSSMMGAGSSMI
jgi:hypothetical protein